MALLRGQVTGGGGTPGGASGDIQYNNGGSFGGVTGFTFSGGLISMADNIFRISDNTDATKKIAWEASGITTGQTRTITMVDYSGTQVLSSGALTATRVPFMTATGLADSSFMVWDNTNAQLAILSSGTAAIPTIGISGTNIGLWMSGTNVLGFTTQGTNRFNLDATSFRSPTTGGGIVRSAAGAVGTPTFSFAGDTNTGIWNSSADTLAFVASGANQFFISDTNYLFGTVSGSASIKGSAGTAAAPAYAFTGDLDTGFWSNAANTIKVSVLGGQTETINTTGHFFGSSTAPTARIHIAAGSASANSAPIKLTSGTVMTTAETGAFEFTTDDLFFTITTGTARKNIALWDTLGTSGRVPFATTNGRLTDDADFTFATDTLTVTKIAATTYTGTQTYADAVDLVFNTTTGSKIGTAVTQKIGFWNVTPVVQPAGANQAAITDSTGGTPGFTLVDVGIVFNQANINNNFASLNRQVDAFRTALVNAGIIKGAA